MYYNDSEYERVDDDVEIVKDTEEIVEEDDVSIVRGDTVEVVSSDVEVIGKPEGNIDDILLEESRKSGIPLSRLYLFEYQKLKLAREMLFLRIEALEEDIARCKFSLKYNIKKMYSHLRKLKREYNKIGESLLNYAYMIFSVECMKCPKSKRLQKIHQNLRRAFQRLDLSTIINNDYCKKCPFYDPHKRVILSLYQRFKKGRKIRYWFGVRGGGYRRRPRGPFRRM